MRNQETKYGFDVLIGFQKIIDENLPLADLDESLAEFTDDMSPSEELSFESMLQSLGSSGTKLLKNPKVAKVGKAALPKAFELGGAMIGGPVGKELGKGLGNQTSQALFKGDKGAKKDPSSTASQLLNVTNHPAFHGTVGAQAVGNATAAGIVLDNGKKIPMVSILNLVIHLATDLRNILEQSPGSGHVPHDYLVDDEGEALADPAIEEERCEALYLTLTESEDEAVGY